MSLKKPYQEFITALQQTTFQGDIATDYAARLSVATDNSIYQVIPEAVIFPCDTQDISIALTLGHQEKFREITFSPRGGGTATNGQSLSAGIIIDCSRHMRTILEINLEEKWVRVQPGVVLDQLNVYLKPFHVYFAPEISPSNRATLGGMANTDACGNGSHILGRTSDHVINLTCVLSDGSIIESDTYYEKFTTIFEALTKHRELILEKFTNTPRTLGGYNLKKALLLTSLTYLLCGSEGTLAIVSECKLKLSSIPHYKRMVLVKYRNFDDALHAPEFSDEIKPLVIEAIDEKLIELARQDAIYFKIKEFIENDTTPTGAVNLVEFVSDHEEKINHAVDALCKIIDKNKQKPHCAIGYYVAKNQDEIKLIWELRKKSVGLISKKVVGTRRPIPFIEDTAVPPEKLSRYISDFKTILDSHGLTYGMYGHVDAGCIHVRPALDMKLTSDEKLMQTLSDNVVALVKKYGGILWGEHGQGHRCEYGIEFFGETLYQVVRQIKTLFDPFNQLNPGKIAVPFQQKGSLVKLSGPLRAHFDKQIPSSWQQAFSAPIACNGNGACFNYATIDTMCPSFKVTQDRIHSPKGRSGIFREWLRLLAEKNVKINFDNNHFLSKIFCKNKKDFSHQVYDAMAGCLGCKACASQCPLNVDVPEFKSKFLALYHQRYFRPLRDYFIASIETTARLQAFFPRLTNWFLQRKFFNFILQKFIKLSDAPPIGISRRHFAQSEQSYDVILLQDVFTSYFEPHILSATYDFLSSFGLTVNVVPFFANGKPWHVKGFLKKFNKIATKNSLYLRQLAKQKVPILGIDPSMTLTYRDEYQKIRGTEPLGFNVLLLQEWLVDYLHQRPKKEKTTDHYYLISHCTEKTACVESEIQWQKIFAAFGLELTILPVGCCGMAGSYGHEIEHLENSKRLFAMDWQAYLTEKPENILATGYSCRSQVKRLMGITLRHPIEILRN